MRFSFSEFYRNVLHNRNLKYSILQSAKIIIKIHFAFKYKKTDALNLQNIGLMDINIWCVCSCTTYHVSGCFMLAKKTCATTICLTGFFTSIKFFTDCNVFIVSTSYFFYNYTQVMRFVNIL